MTGLYNREVCLAFVTNHLDELIFSNFFSNFLDDRCHKATLDRTTI